MFWFSHFRGSNCSSAVSRDPVSLECGLASVAVLLGVQAQEGLESADGYRSFVERRYRLLFLCNSLWGVGASYRRLSGVSPSPGVGGEAKNGWCLLPTLRSSIGYLSIPYAPEYGSPESRSPCVMRG